jgi:hypothetical protein
MLVAGGRLGCHIVIVTHSARPGRGRRVMGAGDDRAVSVAVLRSGPSRRLVNRQRAPLQNARGHLSLSQ